MLADRNPSAAPGPGGPGGSWSGAVAPRGSGGPGGSWSGAVAPRGSGGPGGSWSGAVAPRGSGGPGGSWSGAIGPPDRGLSAEHPVADRDGDVGVVAEHAVDPELVEQLQLGREVAGRLEVHGAGGVALAEVLRQEVVLPSEGPRVDHQPGLVGVADQRGRVGEAVLRVAGHDQVLARPDAVGVAGDLRPAGLIRSA